MKKRRKFSKETKRQIIEEVQVGELSLAEVLRKYEISASVYYGWLRNYERGKFDNEPTKEGELLNRIAELERKVGQQAMEIDLLKKLKEIQQRRINEKRSSTVITGPSKGGVK